MSGTGRVIEVDPIGYLPRETKPAQRVRVEVEGSHDVMFWIPVGPAPAVGDTIEWWPHYARWRSIQVHKLTEAWDPDDPALYTG